MEIWARERQITEIQTRTTASATTHSQGTISKPSTTISGSIDSAR